MENVERAMQAERVRRKADEGAERKTDEGAEEVPGEYVYNGSVANKALELIGKELGMFIDRKEVGEPNEFARERRGTRCVHTRVHRVNRSGAA